MTPMQAWVVQRPGPVGPDRTDDGSLQAVERELPEPGPGEVRVQVRACGVCRTDLHLAEGDLAPRRPRTVPGHEVVGVVDAVGPGSGRFAVGDRIGVAWLRGTCGRCRWCRTGRENLCPDAAFTGWDADGGYAEFAVAPEAFAYRLPGAWTTSRRRRCCARGSSATGRWRGRTCRRAAGSASTGSGRRRTSSPRSPSPRARRCTC